MRVILLTNELCKVLAHVFSLRIYINMQLENKVSGQVATGPLSVLLLLLNCAEVLCRNKVKFWPRYNVQPS